MKISILYPQIIFHNIWWQKIKEPVELRIEDMERRIALDFSCLNDETKNGRRLWCKLKNGQWCDLNQLLTNIKNNITWTKTVGVCNRKIAAKIEEYQNFSQKSKFWQRNIDLLTPSSI